MIEVWVSPATSQGICRFTWVGETKNNGDSRSVPILSRIFTVVPPNIVGKGFVVADFVVVANPVPNVETIASLAKGVIHGADGAQKQ